MPDPLTFVIVADNGQVTLDALYGSVERVRKLVHDVEHSHAATLSAATAWYVTELHSSSPTITLPLPPTALTWANMQRKRSLQESTGSTNLGN